MEDTKSDLDQVGALPAAADTTTDSFDSLTVGNTQSDLLNRLISAETSSSPQQQPNCDATETPGLHISVDISSSPDLRRSSSSSGVTSSRNVGFGIGSSTGRRNRSRSGGDDGDGASSELVLQLQKVCRRKKQHSEERAFVRDVEHMLTLLRVQTPTSIDAGVTSATFPGPAMSLKMLGSVQEEDGTAAEKRRSFNASDRGVSFSGGLHMPRVTLTLAEIDAMLDCIADLFDHRNASVRALAFEVVQLCLLCFGERLTPELRRKIYLRLETHPPGDFLLRQTALRALTEDGRHLKPFHVELGWFLLRLLEQSDAQRDLLGLIQSIFRRSPQTLDRDKVIAIVSVISVRCDMAWSRGDLNACHNFVAFFHTLATHNSAYAASTPVCLRSLCCLVNADGHGTWSVMKLLLHSSSGFLVLRGLLQVLEHPTRADSPWVLRGAVFFVGMSCWGSQRVAKFDDITWAPILLALERALQCCRGVVIFEVILSIQRLIRKFGATRQPASSGQSAVSSITVSSKPALYSGDSSHDTREASLPSISCFSDTSSASGNGDKRCLVMEWDIILRMLHALRPWVSMTHENAIEKSPQRTLRPDNERPRADMNRSAAMHPTNGPSNQSQHQVSVSIQQTRIPRELLDTLQTVEDLAEQHRFAGDVDEFLRILEDYLPHLSENSMLFLLRQRAEAAHPGYHINWLATLSSAMRTFFSGISYDGDSLAVPRTVRLEALEVLRANLWTSRNVCEDRVIEEIVIPTLGRVYEDSDAEVRRRALEFIIEVTRQLESVKFESLLDILASAMTLSTNEDAQLVAASGIASLFSSAFDHLPPARAVRMYDLLATTVEIHRSRAVRHIALSCLLYVCEARANDGRLQWKEQQQIRTSRFLFVSRRAARLNAPGVQVTAACVPVARALRALLTLLSAESDAELFRMAVKGIKTMLENRAILEDVDVSEMSTKVVASIDYRAFGRAAVTDEIDRLLNEPMNEQKPDNGDKIIRRNQKARVDCKRGTDRLVSLSDAELIRSIHASTRLDNTGGSKVSFCASVRSTAALLVKTEFFKMGTELLQLLVSYESELHDNALQELARCLVGAMTLPLAVAEKDLFVGGSATGDSTLSSSSSAAPDMLYRHDEAKSQLGVTDRYASGTHLGFTSRVLSRFQTSASQVDGDFRSDAFVAILELLGIITPMLPTEEEDRGRSACKAIIEALLLGFEYAKSKQHAYLAFRLLCQVIYQSKLKERVYLADLAMPTLQQCTHRGNSLLVEAAIDFLMCYAYSQSALAPSALCTRQEPDRETINDKAVSSSHSERAVKGYGIAMQNEDRGEVQVMQNTTFQQSTTATALPPLPAYDGIGGSPSYYCENAQVCRQTQRNMERLTPKNKRGHFRQAEGDDGQEDSSSKSVIRATREDVEEHDDTESRQGLAQNNECGSEMDAFSLDDSLGCAPSISAKTPRLLQFADSSSSTTLDPNAVGSMREISTLLDEEQYDPKYLMMQLFDLTVENRPQLLSDGPALKLALSVLDRTPEFETHKIGLLYVRDEKQFSEATILGNTGGSLRYLRFLRRLGTFTKLKGLSGYTGGLDTVNNSDGKFGLIYKDSWAEITFHVATMMAPGSNCSDVNLAPGIFTSMKKKRHIGNDFVHVVFKECDEGYDLQTLSGQFNDVHIVIQPLNDNEYRTEVHVKQGIPPFGPLYGRQIVSSSIISESVRITCLNANLACQVYHQDLVGFALNSEERLKQIKQLSLRLATSDEWKVE
ncbi:unnamed protein product [Peronospora destructor]|uniref:Rap-GAP domain-containing protein n=1 Tax=Peronospora destructor TaxID=86335 RepID=A0AAV0UIN6_9STRA|nr:unnamed protein product [Peronospora destructor]